MANCTCKKLNCDSECLCNCHRDAFPELKKLSRGLDNIDNAVDLCIERMQKFNLKK